MLTTCNAHVKLTVALYKMLSPVVIAYSPIFVGTNDKGVVHPATDIPTYSSPHKNLVPVGPVWPVCP